MKFAQLFLCSISGGHVFVDDVCSRCGAEQGGPTIIDLLHEFSMRQIKPLCRACWLKVSRPEAYLYASKEPQHACDRCKAITTAPIWVKRS